MTEQRPAEESDRTDLVLGDDATRTSVVVRDDERLYSVGATVDRSHGAVVTVFDEPIEMDEGGPVSFRRDGGGDVFSVERADG